MSLSISEKRYKKKIKLKKVKAIAQKFIFNAKKIITMFKIKENIA